jgi:hypothetical protein
MPLPLLPLLLLLVSLQLLVALLLNVANVPGAAGVPSVVRVLAVYLTIPPIAIALHAPLTSLLLRATQLLPTSLLQLTSL